MQSIFTKDLFKNKICLVTGGNCQYYICNNRKSKEVDAMPTIPTNRAKELAGRIDCKHCYS